jgi:hypothetical protein
MEGNDGQWHVLHHQSAAKAIIPLEKYSASQEFEPRLKTIFALDPLRPPDFALFRLIVKFGE